MKRLSKTYEASELRGMETPELRRVASSLNMPYSFYGTETAETIRNNIFVWQTRGENRQKERAGATAEFVQSRKGSKTPFNVKLGSPNGKDTDWFGCGFYYTSIAFCRDMDMEKSQKTIIVIETKEGTEGIRLTAYDGRFKHELTRE